MTTDITRQDASAPVSERELCSQPGMWERVQAEPQRTFDLLPGPDERLATQLPVTDQTHFVFLGTGPGAALTAEAALTCREASGVWAEAYPVHEHLHGPIAAAGERSLVWSFAPGEDDLAAMVCQTSGHYQEPQWDPQAELVLAHRVAVELASRAGRNPDKPRYLNRSVT